MDSPTLTIRWSFCVFCAGGRWIKLIFKLLGKRYGLEKGSLIEFLVNRWNGILRSVEVCKWVGNFCCL